MGNLLPKAPREQVPLEPNGDQDDSDERDHLHDDTSSMHALCHVRSSSVPARLFALLLGRR